MVQSNGLRSHRPLLGAACLTAMLLMSAGPVLAATTPDGSLPVVTISTTPEALAAAPDDGTGIVADQPGAVVAAKPAAHRAPRFKLQTIDTTGLSTPLSGQSGKVRPASALVIEARATTLRPAPLPDQDMDAPGPDAQALSAQQQASVAPSFYGNQNHFSGDGFSSGSNLEADKNNRRRPGGGMSLSIPVQ